MLTVLRILIVPAFLVGLPAGAYLALVDDMPAVGDRRPVNASDAARARFLLGWYRHRLAAAGSKVSLSASKRDLNMLLAFGSRSVPGLASRARIDAGEVSIEATWRLPAPLRGRYLNARLAVPAFTDGIDGATLSLGSLSLPGNVTMALTRRALDIVFGDTRGARLIDMVTGMTVVPGRLVTVFLTPPEQLENDLREGLTRVVSLGAPERVGIYYRKLADAAAGRGSTGSVSLAKFVPPLFQLAARRSGPEAETWRIVEENRAALLALAIYFGDSRLEQLVGDVRGSSAREGRMPVSGHATLGGRNDLAKHFLVSAVLELATGSGMAFVAGEFKELLDANPGGSGFSFIDLAADRTGSRFAQEIADPTGGARRIQAMLASLTDEDQFFPAVADLPEWLDRRAFEKRFGSVDSAAYARMMREIDRRISGRPAFVPG